MKRIFKYRLPVQGCAAVDMVAGAQVLSVGAQDGHPTVWALVEDAGEFARPLMEPRQFYIAFTGAPIPDEVLQWAWLGTVLLSGGQLVCHVWEAPEPRALRDQLRAAKI